MKSCCNVINVSLIREETQLIVFLKPFNLPKSKRGMFRYRHSVFATATAFFAAASAFSLPSQPVRCSLSWFAAATAVYVRTFLFSRAGHATSQQQQREHVFRPQKCWLLHHVIIAATSFRQRDLKIFHIVRVTEAQLRCRVVCSFYVYEPFYYLFPASFLIHSHCRGRMPVCSIGMWVSLAV